MKKRIHKNRATNNVSAGQVQEEFSGNNLTHFGGTGLIRRFLERLDVCPLLDNMVRVEGRRECTYSVGQMLLSLLYALFLGYARPTHMATLRADKVFQRLAGLTAFPVPSTISRFLSRVKMAVAHQVGQANYALLSKARDGFARCRSLTLDLDSHVTPVYGRQQGAALGYNPKKKGRRSYQPLLCFIGETRDYLGGWLRGGKTATARQHIRFLKRMLDQLPDHVQRLRLRADSGFFSLEILQFARRKGIEYYIVVPLQPWVQKTILQIRSWKRLNRNVEVAETVLTVGKHHTYRLVLIRQRVRQGQKPKKQLSLLNLDEEIYDYQAIVTSSRKAPEDVWGFYRQRATCENFIKESIYGFGLDKVVSHHYAGNAVYFQLVMMAYNLMNLFKEQVLGQHKVKETVQILRQRLFLIPGKLCRSARRNILKLPEDWAHQDEFDAALVTLL